MAESDQTKYLATVGSVVFSAASEETDLKARMMSAYFIRIG
jgi:hypothetical protein